MMTRILTTRRLLLILAVAAGFWLTNLLASSGNSQNAEPTPASNAIATTPDANVLGESPSGPDATKEVSEVLIGLIIILLAAKIGGDLMERIKHPAVLGELLFGIIVGNFHLLGLLVGSPDAAFFQVFEPFKHSLTLEVLAEIGVVILLFDIGLDHTTKEMMEVGVASFLVATFGVVAPFFLGWGVGAWFLPNESIYVHVFLGATLTATSVGITARVLQDIGREKTHEARIILGAAVIDDVMGLVILAVVAGIISAAAGQGRLSSLGVFLIIVKAVIFILGALVIGQVMAPRIFSVGERMQGKGILLSIALMICFVLAWLAAQVGLAPIVGAFAAGLILEKVHYKGFTDRGEKPIKELIAPVYTMLVPIFFVRMGMMVDLKTLGRVDILLFAAILTLAAIVGKQACSLAIFSRGVNRLAIGLGMIPRGEVGLIFASIGSKLVLDNHPVVSSATFSAVVIMVMVTTLITPPVLKIALERGRTASREPAPPKSPNQWKNDGD
jgi:Kef-type K+ transport system membrane component KefB